LPTPSTVPEVIAGIRAVEAAAPASDGVVCFARLYLQVTETVRDELARTTFADAAFLERLDVGFAGLFFDTVDAFASDPARAPSAWAPLFAARSRRGIAPIQFALAGMNAHINRDLPVALVAAYEAAGIELSREAPEHDDYERVNGLLAQVEAKAKAAYLTGPIAALDRLVHRVDRLDDVLAMWEVRRAREAAWTNAEALWTLRSDAGLRAEFVRTLDRMVGLAGRGLLVPADTFVRRAARFFGGRGL
jgi:Family of unknown function (DUF5995)